MYLILYLFESFMALYLTSFRHTRPHKGRTFYIPEQIRGKYLIFAYIFGILLYICKATKDKWKIHF